MQQSAKNNSEDDNAGRLPEPETAHERNKATPGYLQMKITPVLMHTTSSMSGVFQCILLNATQYVIFILFCFICTTVLW